MIWLTVQCVTSVPRGAGEAPRAVLLHLLADGDEEEDADPDPPGDGQGIQHPGQQQEQREEEAHGDRGEELGGQCRLSSSQSGVDWTMDGWMDRLLIVE